MTEQTALPNQTMRAIPRKKARSKATAQAPPRAQLPRSTVLCHLQPKLREQLGSKVGHARGDTDARTFRVVPFIGVRGWQPRVASSVRLLSEVLQDMEILARSCQRGRGGGGGRWHGRWRP